MQFQYEFRYTATGEEIPLDAIDDIMCGIAGVPPNLEHYTTLFDAFTWAMVSHPTIEQLARHPDPTIRKVAEGLRARGIECGGRRRR